MISRQTFWSIKNVHAREFPHALFPLVLLNGTPAYVINQWIFTQMKNGVGSSLLEERIRSVLHLFDFYSAKYGNKELTPEESNSLLLDFLNAKYLGSAQNTEIEVLGLEWKRVSKQTTKRYLHAINTFDKWQSTFHGAPQLNPSEERFMTAFEAYSEFKQRSHWDPLLHLFPSQQHKKKVHTVSFNANQAFFSVGSKKLPKAFPLSAFVDLVEHSANPRDKMLWLQMFGIGVRQSETLHQYLEDNAGTTGLGETKIRLDDPVHGAFRWQNSDGKIRTGTRAEFLSELFRNPEFAQSCPSLFRLAPRTEYVRNRNHAGFKGMTFDTDDTEFDSCGHVAQWIDPRLGAHYQSCLEEYLQEHFFGKPARWPYHPYLFIQLDKGNYGLPLSLAALKKAWERAMNREKLTHLGLGPHSLRHLTGYYCANALRLPMELTRTFLRHAQIDSTKVYYHLTANEVRKQILEANARLHGFSIRDFLVLPGDPKLELPPHWVKAGMQHKRQ